MKKITFLSLLVFAAVSLFVGCKKGQPQLQNVRGVVKHYIMPDSIEVNDSALNNDSVLNNDSTHRKDSVKAVKVMPKMVSIPDMVVGIEGGDSMVFSMRDARIQNGLAIPGDSVIIDYIEGEEAFRALVVTRLEADAIIVDTDTIKHFIDRRK